MSVNKIFFKSHILILTAIIFTANGCKKYVEIPPPTDKITSGTVFTDASSIASAMSGLYNFCFISGDAGNSFATATPEWWLADATDDAITTDPDFLPFYTNVYALNDAHIGGMYGSSYISIGNINTFIAGVSGSTVISESQKTHYIVQAKIMRAYYYFILTNLYGDVPLVVNNDFETNAFLPRAPRASVDSLILSDLISARDALTATEGDNYTFNQNTANALLARMYGYMKNWSAEEVAANAVINSSRYSLAPQPANVFDRDNAEAIYQVPNTGTWYDGLVPTTYIGYGIITSMTSSLVNNFEAGDLRASQWIFFDGANYQFNKYFAYTYTAPPQEQVLIRLADVILLRAEARAEQNELTDAIDDINMIRERAGLKDLPNTLNQQQTIQAMMTERRNEFFGEDITRWFDLSRWGLLQSTMSTAKPTTWTLKANLFPITLDQLKLNPNLTQNPGY